MHTPMTPIAQTSLVLGAGFAAVAFAAVALSPGLATRATVVLLTLVAFAALAWARVLDADERAYVRDATLRATARFRIA